jgi:hypothetical protein
MDGNDHVIITSYIDNLLIYSYFCVALIGQYL